MLAATLILQLLIVRILTACFFMYVVKTLHVPQKIHVRLRGLGVKTSAKTAFKT